MDQGAFLFSVCMMVICLLGTVRCPNSDNKSNCPCPEIPSVNQTEPPPRTCFQVNSSYRYSCKGGYVRKAGTSNRITCEEVNGVAKWSQLSLVCIPDPKIKTTTRKPNITVTKDPTDIPHQPVITTTDTAPSSPQTNRGTHMSASVTAGTDRTEPASPDLSITTEHTREDPTDIPHQPVITTTDTAPSSPQTNRGTHMSASVTAGTDRTEPASPDLLISTEHTREDPTDIPHQPVITTTDTAPSSPQTNRGTHMSASVTAGTDRTEPASPDLLISTEHTREDPTDIPHQPVITTTDKMYVGWSSTTAMTTSISTATEPANNSSFNSPVAVPKHSTTTALVTCASLVIICALIGLGLAWYRRKLKSSTPVRTAEEAMPMKQEPSTLRS